MHSHHSAQSPNTHCPPPPTPGLTPAHTLLCPIRTPTPTPKKSAPPPQVACVKVGMGLALPAALLVPAASLFMPAAPDGALAALFLALGVKSLSKTLALSSSTILVNLFAPKAEIGGWLWGHGVGMT